MPRTLFPLVCLVPALALAQNAGAPLRGNSLVVNNGPGDQTDPHVSGSRVAYTHQPSLSSSEIRYHDLDTGEDRAIPNEGGYDSIADIHGDTVVFTRITSASRVYRFDVRQGGPAQELAKRTGADRRAATIGGQRVAWQELGYGASTQAPEIFAYHLDSSTLTRLSEDTSVDRTPAVSEDGSTVAWTKCANSLNGCDIWLAQAVEGGYDVRQLTGLEGEESQPDTNGEVVAYVSRRTVDGVVEADIAWQPAGGGEAWRLALPGTDSNPNVSGPLIAFERREATADGSLPNFDVMLYDLRTQTFYRLTQTPESETLNDISVGTDGVVRVVWSVRESGNLNVYAFAFGLPPADCKPPADTRSPAEVCASPGARPLVGTLQVTRSTGKSERLSTALEAKGSGVLCVDNAHEGSPATAGWVWLGTDLHVGPEDFRHDVTGVARAVSLQGSDVLSAQVQGKPGSAFRVRLYGEPTTCGSQGDVKAGDELRHGELIPPQPLDMGPVKAQPTRYFVPSGYEGPVAPVSGEGTQDGLRPMPLPSCSAGGSGSLFLLGLWGLAVLPRRDRSSRSKRRFPVASRR
jgi:Tol biopolymer transport system component